MGKFSLKLTLPFVLLKLAIQSQKPAPRGRAFARCDVGIRNFAPARSPLPTTLSTVLIKSIGGLLIPIIGIVFGKILLILTEKGHL
jgi:hypothetical protein